MTELRTVDVRSIAAGTNHIGAVSSVDLDIDFHQRITPVGSSLTEQVTRLVGSTFNGGANTYFWTTSNSGASSASGIANTIATMTSGTANNGYGHITSVKSARFIFSHPNFYRAAIRVTAATVADCTRRWGAFTSAANPYDTPTSGYGFELSGAGVLSLKTWASGAAVGNVSSGSFNGAVASYTVDTNVHAYEIIYFVMGVWFFIDGVLIHKFTPTTAVLTSVKTQKVSATSFNSGSGTTSGTLEFWDGVISRYGQLHTAPTALNINSNATTVLKNGAGTLTRVVVNKKGAGSTTTVYDNTAASGTVIAVIDSANAPGGSFEFGLDFFTGLTVVTGGGTAPDITVVYE